MAAKAKMLGSEGPKWALVSGPADAVVATAARLQWDFVDSSTVKCDDGAVLDLLLDPPIIVADAVKRAVRRWRTRNMALNLPALIPAQPDISYLEVGRSSKEVLLNFAEELGSLAQCRKAHSCPSFDLWSDRNRADLVSAVSGGQWPQARLASVKHWTDTNLCQLCKEHVGTLAHRLVCPAIVPPEGWQPAPCKAAMFQEMDGRRHELLSTRGLATLRLVLPAIPNGDTFEWICAPECEIPEDATWYIDGSLFDESKR